MLMTLAFNICILYIIEFSYICILYMYATDYILSGKVFTLYATVSWHTCEYVYMDMCIRIYICTYLHHKQVYEVAQYSQGVYIFSVLHREYISTT